MCSEPATAVQVAAAAAGVGRSCCRSSDAECQALVDLVGLAYALLVVPIAIVRSRSTLASAPGVLVVEKGAVGRSLVSMHLRTGAENYSGCSG